MKLDIGCGNKKKEGYVGLDISKNSDADIIASALDIPIEDGRVSRINCSHLLEHFNPIEARQLFNEIYRILEIGGRAFIKVDRDWTYKRLMRKDPIHKYRYSRREIAGMLTHFATKKVEQKVYLYGKRLKKKIFVELVKAKLSEGEK